MTRINVVPVEELCDQHLLAEHRELKRIPNCIAQGKFSLKNVPNEYTLGTGHVSFFYQRLAFLKERYVQLHNECLKRGFNVQWMFPDDTELPKNKMFWNNYVPTEKALHINRERINIRIPAKARYTQYKENI